MHLFEVEVQTFRNHGQFGHVLFAASRMAADEIRYYLLPQVVTCVYFVEYLFELLKLLERRLAHQFQDIVRGVFRGDFQPSADVVAYEFTGVFPCRLVAFFVSALVQQQVIAHAAADETLLDAWHGVNGSVYFQ